jgi:hypothetical protein
MSEISRQIIQINSDGYMITANIIIIPTQARMVGGKSKVYEDQI